MFWPYAKVESRSLGQRSGKVRRSKTSVLPLCNAANHCYCPDTEDIHRANHSTWTTVPRNHGWLRGTVVERLFFAGELSLSCARPAPDGWPLIWINVRYKLSNQVKLKSAFHPFGVDKWVVSCNQMYIGYLCPGWRHLVNAYGVKTGRLFPFVINVRPAGKAAWSIHHLQSWAICRCFWFTITRYTNLRLFGNELQHRIKMQIWIQLF